MRTELQFREMNRVLETGGVAGECAHCHRTEGKEKASLVSFMRHVFHRNSGTDNFRCHGSFFPQHTLCRGRKPVSSCHGVPRARPGTWPIASVQCILCISSVTHPL